MQRLDRGEGAMILGAVVVWVGAPADFSDAAGGKGFARLPEPMIGQSSVGCVKNLEAFGATHGDFWTEGVQVVGLVKGFI